jgi:F-type H+-transporting ATPase subunit a
LHHEKVVLAGNEHGHEGPMDFSITKSVFGMMLVIVILLVLFRVIAKRYKGGSNQAPTGIQNAIEPFILFIRDEVAIPSLGHKKAERYLPFLLTTFFFIWMCNMLGLIPFIGGFNVTGTLSITLVLATVVFLITSFSGNGHYWGHIFWPPGVPFAIKLILVPIELMSIFIKPAVLMIRLTANITAGHIIILAFVGLALLFGEKSAVAGYSVGVGSVLFMIFMFFIELLVAFLQAYVFTLLAALYFGDATQEHHVEEHH